MPCPGFWRWFWPGDTTHGRACASQRNCSSFFCKVRPAVAAGKGFSKNLQLCRTIFSPPDGSCKGISPGCGTHGNVVAPCWCGLRQRFWQLQPLSPYPARYPGGENGNFPEPLWKRLAIRACAKRRVGRNEQGICPIPKVERGVLIHFAELHLDAGIYTELRLFFLLLTSQAQKSGTRLSLHIWRKWTFTTRPIFE